MATFAACCMKWTQKGVCLMQSSFSLHRRSVSYIYDLSLKTGNTFGAGTDANIFVRLIGERGSTDEIKIKTKKSDLERGMTNRFQISVDEDVGALEKIIIRHDNSGMGPAWLLDKVDIIDNRGRKFQFDCQTWLVKDGATNPIILLKANNPEVQRAWKKKEKKEEIIVDEGLKKVVESFINFDNMFETQTEVPKEDHPSEQSTTAEEQERQDELLPSPPRKHLACHTTSISPAVKNLVDTHGITFFNVDGTGPHGRILKGDVINYMKENNIKRIKPMLINFKPDLVKQTKTLKTNKKSTLNAECSKQFQNHDYYHHPLYTDSPLPDNIIEAADRLVNNKFNTPHFYMNCRCSTGKFDEYCSTFKDNFNEHSFSVLFVKAVVKSLQQLLLQKEEGMIESTLQLGKIKLNIPAFGERLLVGLNDRNLEEIYDSFKVFKEEENITSESAAVSISVTEENDVTQLSSVLQHGEVLSIVYSRNRLQQIDPVTLERTSYGNLSLTCNGTVIADETGAKLLGLLKRLVENPETVLL